MQNGVDCNGGVSKEISDNMKSNGISKKSLANGISSCIPGKNHYQRRWRTGLFDILFGIFKILLSILVWMLLIFYIIIPLAPIVLLFVAAKYIERYAFCYLTGAEAVTGGDSVWMSNGPENPGIISSLMTFNGEVGLEQFRKKIFATMIQRKAGSTPHPYRRSTRKVSKTLLNYFWTEEENFDINDHLKLHPSTVNSKLELRHVVSELCTVPFRKGISQWDLVIIPWIQNGVRKTGVVFRVNHSLADGGALVNFLTNVLPDQEGEPVKIKKFSQSGRLFMYLKGTLYSPFFVLKMLFRAADATVLHGASLTGKKAVTWSEPMDIEIFKKIKSNTKTTLNDVLVSCMAAAIREFFDKRDLKPPNDLKVSVPIDLRKNTVSDAVEFENRFAVLQVSLPVGISDPLEQLYELQNRMNALKSSGEPFAVGPTMELLLDILPTWIISPFFNFIVQKCTGVFSNVPGPQNSLTIVGQELESLTFWAPPRGNLGMTFSITSYNGKVVIGVQSDKAILGDPDKICKEFPSQVQRLMNRLNMNKE